MALRYIECNAEMLEYLGSKKREGGGGGPSAMSETCIFIRGQDAQENIEHHYELFQHKIHHKEGKMHVVSKYKHLASIPTDMQKGTAENWMGIEQVLAGYSAAIQTTTSGQPFAQEL